MLRDIRHVIAFEFSTLRSSARIWLASAIFTIIGLIAALIYSGIVKEVKGKATEVVTNNVGIMGNMVVDDQLEQLYAPAVFEVVKHVVDCNGSVSDHTFCAQATQIASSCDQQICDLFNEVIHVSPLMLFSFLIMTLVIPFLITLLSFDMITNDIQYRTASYPLLRISRVTWYFGKLGAHTILAYGLSLLMLLVIFGVGIAILPNFEFLPTLFFTGKCALLLLPFTMAYVGLISIWSALFSSPFMALLTSLGSLMGFGIINLLANNISESPSRFIFKGLVLVTPSFYNDLLWSTGVMVIAVVAIYFGLAALYGTIATLIIKKRDI